MFRALLIAGLACACSDGGDGGGPIADAGLDAQRRLAVTVEGPPALAITRSVTVKITANGSTRIDTFLVGGLPSTVDVPAPIQLSAWSIEIDGFDGNGKLVGHGSSEVPSGTADTTITLVAVP